MRNLPGIVFIQTLIYRDNICKEFTWHHDCLKGNCIKVDRSDGSANEVKLMHLILSVFCLSETNQTRLELPSEVFDAM